MVCPRSVVMVAVLVHLGAATFAHADPADPAGPPESGAAAAPPDLPAGAVGIAGPMGADAAAFHRSSTLELPIVQRGGSAVVQTEGFGGDTELAFVLDVQNVGGDTLMIVPTVLGIAALDRADAPAVRRMVPRPARPAAAAPAAVEVAGRSPAAIQVPLAGLDGPGIYEIETELADRDHRLAPKVVNTIVYRRRSWLWAALWIAFGAVIAFGARLYIDGGAARLKLRRRIALLLQQIRAARERCKGDAVSAAARALELDVDDRRRYARWGGSVDDVKCAIDRAELRLALLREIVDAAALLERLAPARQPLIRKTLDDAIALVQVDSTDEAPLRTMRGDVSRLGLAAEWRDQLEADLALLEDQVAVRLPAALPVHGAALRALGGELAQARAALASGQLEAAATQLDEVRPKLLAAAADQLAQLLVTTPPGVDADAWRAASDAIAASLAEARAEGAWVVRWAAFKAAQDGYIVTAVTGLIALAKQLAAIDPQSTARMTEVATELDAALKDPVAAAALYDPRRHEIEVARRPTMRGAVAAVPMAARMWLPLALGGSAAKPEQASMREVKMLDLEVTWTSWMVNAAILLIAVASGVKALWLDDLAWGAHGASLTAFLWGAGVQAVGNAFAGLASLRSRLGAA